MRIRARQLLGLLGLMTLVFVIPFAPLPQRAGVALAGAVHAGPVVPVVIDFESGPPVDTGPVTDEYVAAHVRFVRDDQGFRPYRRVVPAARAHSGTHVVDVGLDVCTMELDDAQNCEFSGAGTQGRLTRTAKSVTVFAGLFRATGNGQVTARLIGLRADGTEAVSSAAIPIDATGFHTAVTVTSDAADIAAFALHAEGPGSVGGSALGFDDLSLIFPDTAPADVALSLGGGELVLLQGVTLDVPLSVERVNGSNGRLALSVSGLPPQISATFTPNPVPGTQSTAVMRLTATTTAAASSFVPFTVTGDPQGNPGVAPAARVSSGAVRVSANFEITAKEPGTPQLGYCAAVEYPLLVQRSEVFDGLITLTADNLPPGVTATFVPGNTFGPRGSIVYQPRLRLSREPIPIKPWAAVRVLASSPGVPDRILWVSVGSEGPTAAADGPTGDGVVFGYAPMRQRPGTELTLVGNGFCQGTQVEVGNVAAVVDTTVAADGRSLKFNIPRLATNGPITVNTPGAPSYVADNEVQVRTFRSYYGFQFSNFKWGVLSWEELIDVVGEDDLFARVNPCWPWYDCSVQTPLPHAGALQSWLELQILAELSKGHCFGIVRTQQELLAGHVGYDNFAQDADHPFDLGSPTGPGSDLGHHLDGRHVAQWTEEFARAFINRSHDVDDQIELIIGELRAGRYPGVAIFKEDQTWKFKGHVVTAYDVEQSPTDPDKFKIYVYDNKNPFVEDNETGGETARYEHELRETGKFGVIDVDSGRWTFDRDKKGIWTGTGGTIWAFTFDDLPANPTLIRGALSLSFSMGQFASDDEAAQVSSIPDGAEWLPILDDNATPMVAGSLLAPGSQIITHTVTGTKDGTYSELFAGKGFSAGVIDVPTSTGVTDQVTSAPAERTLEFAGARKRPLQLSVTAALPGGATHTAYVRTTAADGGRDLARIDPDGAVVYEHHGAATEFSIELTSGAVNTSIARFISAPLHIADGDRVTGTPEDWSELTRVSLNVRHADGTTDVQMLETEPLTGDLDVRIGEPTLSHRDAGDLVTVEVALNRVPDGSVGGVVQELRHDGEIVASRGFAVAELIDGTRIERWPLPADLPSGTYDLTTHFNVITGGAKTATKQVTGEAKLTLVGSQGDGGPISVLVLVGIALAGGAVVASIVLKRRNRGRGATTQ